MDVGEVANSLIFDIYKVPYYRPFGEAINNVSKYAIDDENSGIGIPSLDLVLNLIAVPEEDIVARTFRVEELGWTEMVNSFVPRELQFIDLSFSEFQPSGARPREVDSCAESYPISYFNYDCRNLYCKCFYKRRRKSWSNCYNILYWFYCIPNINC